MDMSGAAISMIVDMSRLKDYIAVELDEPGQFRAGVRDLRRNLRIVDREREIRELESRPYRTRDEGVGTRGAPRLPRPGGDDSGGPRLASDGPEPNAPQPALIEQHQLDCVSFVIVPHLVGHDAVPPAVFAGRQQEVDRRDR